MGGERDVSQGRETSEKRKHHKHLSKSRSHSRSRLEKRHSKKEKRRHQSSSESSERSTSSDSSGSESASRSDSPAHKKRKKCKDKKKKRHSDKHKKKKKKHHHHHHKKDGKLKTLKKPTVKDVSVIGPAIPGTTDPKTGVTTPDSSSQSAAAGSRIMKPMTKEEWEKKQNEVRRVYDPETGRHRLVRGEGEIIEEIVSRDRHREINKTATRGDGLFYQLQAGLSKHH